jgi:hypothetical protein
MIREGLGKTTKGVKCLDLLEILRFYGTETCLESRYAVCRLPLGRVSRPVNIRVSNPVIPCVESRYRAWLETR